MRPLKPTGPSEPPLAPNAPRISSSVDGRDCSPSAASSLAGSIRSSPRMSASTTPSSVVTGIAFEVAATSIDRNSASASHVLTPGVSTSSGAASCSGKGGCARDGARNLDVGGEIAVLAGDERVLPRARRREEIERLLAAHHPGLGLDLGKLQADTLEDAVVRTSLELEAPRERLVVAVERVRVLHPELAQADQAGARPWLVAFLGRDVVEHLRQLPVALQLTCVERDRLLVRQRQDVVGALSILEAKDLLDEVAAGLLPELERREHRHQHLLTADRVHLLADDLLDLPVHPPAERQEGPHAAGHLADEPAANEELVVDRLRVGGRVAQRREEKV